MPGHVYKFPLAPTRAEESFIWCQNNKGMAEKQYPRRKLTLEIYFRIFCKPKEVTMDEQTVVSTESTPLSVSTFTERMTNVFAAPGDLYAEVARAPVQTTSWLIPYLLTVIVTLLFAFAIFNNQTLRQTILETQQKEIQKQVEEGKMTQENADQATAFMESPMIAVFGAISSAVYVSAITFGMPLVLWLVGRMIFKSGAGYKKMLEVFGLATLIGVIGTIVTLLMMYLFDSFYAAPGGSLAVMGNFDSHNFGHRFLAALNVFTVWETAVVGIGMAKVSTKSVGFGIGVIVGLWLVLTIAISALGWGMR
jgi:hypothetical protein